MQLAPGRLANVADTFDGVLDPARYLKLGRHGDWTPVSGVDLKLCMHASTFEPTARHTLQLFRLQLARPSDEPRAARLITCHAPSAADCRPRGVGGALVGCDCEHAI